jgi:hypothetical protein
MSLVRHAFLPALAAVSLLANSSAIAATSAEMAAGNALLSRYADAIVTVELVAVIPSSSGTPQERRVETNATVISSGGLTLTSLGQIDPRLGGTGGGGRGGRGGGFGSGDTEFREVKLRFADNTEVAARVLLKDADLDLAFIAPEIGAADMREFTHVDPGQAADAAILGTYYDITRVTKLLQRAPIVQMSTIIGIVERPRRVIIADQHTIGCPLFAADGRVLGFSLRYYSGGAPIGSVIVPAIDVADMARQATELMQAGVPGGI